MHTFISVELVETQSTNDATPGVPWDIDRIYTTASGTVCPYVGKLDIGKCGRSRLANNIPVDVPSMK